MSEFKFTPGDKIRRPSWPENCWAEVIAVGKTTVFGRSSGGLEGAYRIDDDWELWKCRPNGYSRRIAKGMSERTARHVARLLNAAEKENNHDRT